jgi:hypothetical protein
MEALFWDSSLHTALGGLLVLAGGAMSFHGIARQVFSLRLPLETRGKNYGWLRAMRQMLQGFALLAIGLGWMWHLPVMITAGAIFGFEETIETSIAAWALKQEAEGREGFA